MAREFVTCLKGHFYDPERFELCPHCYPNGVGGFGGSDSEKTAPIDSNVIYAGCDETVPLETPTPAVDPVTQTEPANKEPEAPAADDLDKTMPFDFPVAADGTRIDPVVGWLVCVKGSDMGKSYTLKAGKNFIGRDSKVSDIALVGDKAVSREKHAIVIFDPKSGKFHAQPGTSSQLYYLNDGIVLQAMELNDRDRISIGNSELVFVAFCNNGFSWADCEA